MEVRSDDNPSTVRHRLGVYKREAAPLKHVFREAGVLVDFPVTGGVRETLPRLMALFANAGAGAKEGGSASNSSNNNNNNNNNDWAHGKTHQIIDRLYSQQLSSCG